MNVPFTFHNFLFILPLLRIDDAVHENHSLLCHFYCCSFIFSLTRRLSLLHIRILSRPAHRSTFQILFNCWLSNCTPFLPSTGTCMVTDLFSHNIQLMITWNIYTRYQIKAYAKSSHLSVLTISLILTLEVARIESSGSLNTG